ncbi:MAG TPA: GntR family transcriptional regulator [Streptosporangiaceae bacterium]|nr:GntR family transcriptional regulator [Streptosporangiaceae bacterium]
MSAPDVGWPAAAGDDETWRSAAPPGGAERPGRGVTGGAAGGGRQLAGRVRPAPMPGPAVSVLADRLAAALVHHEPGWRLPRHSALARRYNVSTGEIDAAVTELVGRHLVRRLADGQLYRASPADYVIGLEGVPGLTTYVDSMGAQFSCRSRQVTWRLPPEDIAWALGTPPDQQVCMIRFLWTAGGEPAALCTTYVPADLAAAASVGTAAGLPTAFNLLQVTSVADIPAQPALDGEPGPLHGAPSALHIEQQAPPPSVARSLRLAAGQPALMITVRFADPNDRPVALTIAVLRPDMFRLIVQTPRPPLPVTDAGGSPVSWAHIAEGWDS